MDSHRPTYIRVHQRHADPRSLDAVGVPWEWDQDPDFIIIKVDNLSQSVLDEIFEHTRELHERHRHQSHNPPDRRRHHRDDSSSRLRYRSPRCFQTGDHLSTEVNLKLPTVKSQAVAVKFVSASDDLGGVGLTIASSRIHGDDKVALYRKDATMDNQPTQFSWVHMQNAARSFDEFTRFASSVPGLADEDVALILSLLKKVKLNEKAAYSGKYFEPMVLRCDGQDPSSIDDTSERSAAFICYPYCSTETMGTPSTSSDDQSIHHTRSLLQTFYNLESTTKRDLEQVVRKTGQFPKDHIVYVPQLWTIILNSRIVITSGPVSPFHASKHSLRILDCPKPQTASSPSVIRVTDHRQRVFFLPAEHCKTWFALTDKILHHCLTEDELHRYECELLTSDNKAIKSGDWQTLINSHNSTILSLRIQLLSSREPLPEDGPPVDDDDSESGDPKKGQSLFASPTRTFTRGSTMGQSSSVGSHHEGRGTSMSLIKRIPTWRRSDDFDKERERERKRKDKHYKEKYDTDGSYRKEDWALTQYYGSDKPPPNRIPKYPLPQSSGVVVNQPKQSENQSPYLDSSSDIYFTPKKTTSAEDGPKMGGALDGALDGGDKESRSSKSSSSSDSTHGPDRSSKDSQGPPVDQREPTSKSTPSASDDTKLHVPSVFTWAVGKSSETSEPSKGVNRSSGDTDTHSAGNFGDQQPEEPHTMIDLSPEEEETLDNVSSHINSQLLETKEYEEDVLYRTAKTMSFFDVEKMIKTVSGASVYTLLSRDLGAKEIEKDDGSPPWRGNLKLAASFLFKLFDYFIPLYHLCDVADKYWGAIDDIFTMIPKLCDLSASSRRLARRTDWYTVSDLSGRDQADLRNDQDMRLLTTDISDCEACFSGKHYSSRSDAWDHLFAKHFTATRDERPTISPNWVMGYEQCLNFQLRLDGQSILDKLIDHGGELERLGLEIQQGVSGNGKFDRETYRIPSSLVDSFRHLLVMVVVAGHLAKRAYQTREEYSGTDIPPYLSFISNRSVARLVQCGSSAEACMNDAKREIVLMTYTGDSSDIVSYEAVSPEFVLALVMGDIRSRDSSNNTVNLIEVYQNYLLKLQFKVTQRPHQRLLQDIHYVVEELEILREVYRYQHLTLGNYRQILKPSSFRVTTEARISSYTLEGERLVKFGQKIQEEMGTIDALILKAGNLSVQTQRGVEVRNEDHGKAILAFTVVTVVFLPMSFVTSYLGMNTVDIRDMSDNQSLFWSISLPLTIGMITITLLVGLKGDKIREWLIDILRKKGEPGHIQRAGHFNPGLPGDNGSDGSGLDHEKFHAKRPGGWREREPKSVSTETSDNFV
ncbi:hypothetical protein FQN54_002354 [Arachnomyces sp. PD_36]|nr:hypothetical protein FQN54_002354 [Arachnomyces sp. PD_36]